MKFQAGGLRLTGDDTGQQPIYFHYTQDRVLISTNAKVLLSQVSSEGISLSVSPTSVSHLLHHALVPAPYTVFDDVYFLGIGDRADFVIANDRIDLQLTNEFPYFCANSTGNSEPDAGHLLHLISASISQRAAGQEELFLMLSSGKDSVSLALAIKEAGLNHVRCGTFVADDRDKEHLYAKALCQRLGLQHETIDIAFGTKEVEDTLTSFFEKSAMPCCDMVQIPYVFCVKRAGLSGGAVIDGTGNDLYMGYLPGPADVTKMRYHIGDRISPNRIAWLLQPSSLLNYFLRNRAEICFSGRTFRYVDTKKFFHEAIDTHEFWRRVSAQYSHLDHIDLRTFIRFLHFEQREVMLKAKLATSFLGVGVLFPYCDSNLIEYYFNLPEQDRFERRTLTNKILLRRMLCEFGDYDAAAMGKNVFRFDGAQFLSRHRNFVSDEISKCKLWSKTIEPLLEKWLRGIDRRPNLAFCLLALFMISGWYNHSRYVR